MTVVSAQSVLQGPRPSVLDGSRDVGARPHLMVVAGMLVVLLAAALRLHDLGDGSLTHDEAWRVNGMRAGDLDMRRWFPPGQMAVSWTLQHALGTSELLVRLPSAACGLGAVMLLAWLVPRRLGLAAGVAAAACLAFHPQAIIYSRVVKEFGYEMLLTVVVAWAGSALIEHPDRKSLRVFTAVSIGAMCFGFAPVLLVAAWGPLALWSLRSARREDPELTRRFILAGIVIVGLAVSLYLWWSGCRFRQGIMQYFTTTEKAWPPPFHPVDTAAWVTDRSWALARYVFGVSAIWEPLATVLATLCLLAGAVGAGVLWRRWRVFVIFTATLLLIAVIAGFARQWPYGAFRNNTYLAPLAAVYVGCGIVELLRVLSVAPARVLVIGSLLVVPAVRAVRAAAQLTPDEHLRPVIAEVRPQLQPDDAIFVYYATDDAFAYYWPDPEVEALVQPRSDRGLDDRFEARFCELLERNRRVWLLMTHPFGDERARWRAVAERHGALLKHITSGTADAWCFVPHLDRAADGAG
ncbi:MAG: glycosyltransferase family 39 protein [Phycisphaerae bacterium]|nr:MAG: hypothetical protein EDS66_10130 [Planctomycetota bacterium]KAB2945166.1 MAG: hypothetical protein F9K17_10390 [Phycisphaerae bacterium]MBE7456793.1 glycosyltransferase family 39 protein [Planctomycetia bacterium]MCK6464242.1 glycosyltransferase family 39 protein [Phycisphaerae bacterium]MCL4717833.1 glycosyltransferase family 39 protein [Phycisphaerae bacterium]